MTTNWYYNSPAGPGELARLSSRERSERAAWRSSIRLALAERRPSNPGREEHDVSITVPTPTPAPIPMTTPPQTDPIPALAAAASSRNPAPAGDDKKSPVLAGR